MEKKPRKVPSGPIRDKERTKRKLIKIVGKVLKQDTFTGLTISNVSKTSGLNPKLIYLYFGSVDELVQKYVEEKLAADSLSKQIKTQMFAKPKQIMVEDIAFLIEKKFEELVKDEEFQGLLHMGLVCKEKNIRSALQRDLDELHALTEAFKKSDDKRMQKPEYLDELALIAGGARYLGLLSSKEDMKFLGLDISQKETQERIQQAIERLLANFN